MIVSPAPSLIALAGPNGAGKSTPFAADGRDRDTKMLDSVTWRLVTGDTHDEG